jgi:RNA polymerase sigma-70 factor, ECF subfamily
LPRPTGWWWRRCALAHAGGSPLQGAIAALHAQAPSYAATDWSQILELYDELLRVWPTPVAALNRAMAMAMVQGPERALAENEALEREDRLDGSP